LPVDVRADSVEQIAALARAHWSLGMESAVLVGVPPPKDAALPRQDVEGEIEAAVKSAEREGVRGKALTPYLLRHLAEATRGSTLSANLALLLQNAEVAARLAVVMARGLPSGAF
jgi:pseudouridine-5'-phosphate glycosidase